MDVMACSPRRVALQVVWIMAAFSMALAAAGSGARADEVQELLDSFEALRTNGNSNCSAAFVDAIPDMSAVSMLQGSCCSPMDQHRYGEQVTALTEFRDIPEIPVNPYDIPAGQAARLMQYDQQYALTAEEQVAFEYAMENSDERGPCCCRCWRWTVYSGLAKFLIHEHGFTGPEIVEVWNLSNGCGGGADHMHG